MNLIITLMNKSRELFLLFKPDVNKKEYNQLISGKEYTVIHRHTFPNDEPPYIMVSYWGITSIHDLFKKISEDEGEQMSFYLIRAKDAERFINLMNDSQNNYCEYYNEGVMTRNAGEHNMSPKEYAEGGYQRPPKIKYIHNLPNNM